MQLQTTGFFGGRPALFWPASPPGVELSLPFTVAEEGETTVTADLKVDFLRPAKPGRLVARATVRHRTRRLAFCEATVEHAHGEVVAEARAVIAYVKA